MFACFLVYFINFLGCVAHTLHLLAQDLLGGEGALQELAAFAVDLQDVVTCFTRSSQLKAQLKEMQVAGGITGLVKQGATRWCSMKRCAESILQSEQILHTLVSHRDFLKSRKDKRAKVRFFFLLCTLFIIY